MSAPIWGRLLCTGANEKEPYRRIELTTAEFAIGRISTCNEVYEDRQISSTHCKITLRRPAEAANDDDDDDTVAEVWLHDASSNGTFLNSQKLGKGNTMRMKQNDEIGFIKPSGGSSAPPYAFIFQDFTCDLEPEELDALLGPTTVPPTPRGGVCGPPGAAPLATPARATSSQSAAAAPVPPLMKLPEPEAWDAELAEAEAMVHSFRILAAPDAQGLKELHGTLRGRKFDMKKFVANDGPQALLDVVAEVQAKPKPSYSDLGILEGTLDALKELLNAPEGIRSILDKPGALDSIVATLRVGEGKVAFRWPSAAFRWPSVAFGGPPIAFD